MDNRLEFVRLAEAGGVSVAELCRRFGISRETGFSICVASAKKARRA